MVAFFRSWALSAGIFFRFHFAPGARQVLAAVRARPFLVLAAVLIVLTPSLARWPGPGPFGWDGQAWFWTRVLGLTLAGLLALPGTLARRRAFYALVPGGRRHAAFWVFWRTLALWTGAWALTAAWDWNSWSSRLPDPLDWLLGLGLFSGGGLALGALAAGAAWASWNRTPSSAPAPKGFPGTGGLRALPAYYLSGAFLFAGPLAVTLALFAYYGSGASGATWESAPRTLEVLYTLTWPLVFGLFWTEASRVVPRLFFRMARTPFRRAAGILGLPFAVSAAAVSGVLVFLGPGDGWWALRCLVLVFGSTAFWFFYWLRWGRTTLVPLAGFLALCTALGATAEGYWALWGLGFGLGAAVLGASVRALWAEESWTDYES